jgi:hypothetical protein
MRVVLRTGLWALAVLAGCAAPPTIGVRSGPLSPAQARVEPWACGDPEGRCITTANYRIHTTLVDSEMLRALPQLMEGALDHYRRAAPGTSSAQRPMDCYIFRNRDQWEQFTRQRAGTDATVYLRIRSGGFTIGDMSVLYFIGAASTFTVAAHEGWHQYCGRHFKGRLPPFLEEGLACTFESVQWERDLPRFNTSVNPQRVSALRRVIQGDWLWPTDKLIALHAGDIVGERMERVDAFYAQSWAFARFLREGESGRYRAGLERWLRDTAAGTVFDPSRTHTRNTSEWSRTAVRPMIEHYTGTDLTTLSEQLGRFMRTVAMDELPAHWRS